MQMHNNATRLTVIGGADMTDPRHVKPNEARCGIKVGAMRYVLGISLAAVIAAFLIVYLVV